MIVKNEAEMLGECLDCVKDLVSEICVVDTGSQDTTREIAKQHGARLNAFLWCEDLGAARNESLRMCSGDWILVLDADERIVQEDIRKIRALVKRSESYCYRIVTRNYTSSESVSEFQPCDPDDPLSRGFSGWFPSAKVRLFPNRREALFEGRVHELVNESLENIGIQPRDCEVVVYHYPLLRGPARTQEKQELYLKLGQEKATEKPDSPKAFIELGNQYAEVRDYEKAAAAYREAVNLDPHNASILKDLGGVLHMAGRSQDAKRALKLALQLDPTLVDAWRNLGVVCVDEKQWQAALDCFRRAIQEAPAWTEGFRFLSVALEGAGELREAAAASRKALEAHPASAESLKLYIHQMLRLEHRAEAREFLAQLVERGANSPILHNVVGELYYYDEVFESAKDHFRAAGRLGYAPAYNNLGVVLFRQGRFAEARSAFEQCLKIDANHQGAGANLEKVLKHL